MAARRSMGSGHLKLAGVLILAAAVRIRPRINYMKLHKHTQRQSLSPRTRIVPSIFLFISFAFLPPCYKISHRSSCIYTRYDRPKKHSDLLVPVHSYLALHGHQVEYNSNMATQPIPCTATLPNKLLLNS
jgi:hypothetical protein